MRDTGRGDAGANDQVRVDLTPLVDASRVITAAIVSSLGEVDPALNVSQVRVLVLVSGRGAMNVSEVAAALGVAASNASRVCDRLVTAGLLDRQEDPDDRRQVSLTLTPAGRDTVGNVMEHRRDVLASVVGLMPVAQQRHLMHSLEAFNRAAVQLDLDRPQDGEAHLVSWVSTSKPIGRGPAAAG